jgi:hypothetical protein
VRLGIEGAGRRDAAAQAIADLSLMYRAASAERF